MDNLPKGKKEKLPKKNFRKEINPSKVRSAEIVVGLPSYNEADSIGFVAEQVDLGLRKYFPRAKAVIINADNCSPDNTREAFLGTKTKTPKIYISTPPGVTGKGNNFYNLFGKAEELGAEILVMADADLKSIGPEWMKKMISPIKSGKCQYVTPVYSRHKYDGTITNNICYPLVYGLFGLDIRQPIGGDFAASIDVVRHWMGQKWTETTRYYGIDIFMACHAILGGFDICQVDLGRKVHKASAPKLGPMFVQVAETLFGIVLSHREAWEHIREVRKTPLLYAGKPLPAQGLAVDYNQIKDSSLEGFRRSEKVIKKILSPENYKSLSQMYGKGEIKIGRKIWAEILYDFLFAYGKGGRKELIESLKALYFGRAASFVKQTLDFDSREAEEEIRKQAGYFFKKRDYFLKKFKGQDQS